jgi:AraC family transcriptional regulator
VRGAAAPAGRAPPPWLRRVRERLEAELFADVPAAELARAEGVHPVSLARAFRAHFGTSPGAFVRGRRIAWAAAALTREPARPITDVALAAGFYDHSHFARVFRAQMGRSPSAYRRAARDWG